MKLVMWVKMRNNSLHRVICAFMMSMFKSPLSSFLKSHAKSDFGSLNDGRKRRRVGSISGPPSPVLPSSDGIMSFDNSLPPLSPTMQ